MDILPNLIEGLLLMSIGGLIKWNWAQSKKIEEVALDLAKNYHGKEELRQVVFDAVTPLMRAIERLERTVERGNASRED